MSHLGRGTRSHIYVGGTPCHIGVGGTPHWRGDPFSHLCKGGPHLTFGGDMHFAFTKEDFLLKLNIFSYLSRVFWLGLKIAGWSQLKALDVKTGFPVHIKEKATQSFKNIVHKIVVVMVIVCMTRLDYFLLKKKMNNSWCKYVFKCIIYLRIFNKFNFSMDIKF